MISDAGHHFRCLFVKHIYFLGVYLCKSFAVFSLNYFLINEFLDFFVEYGYKSFKIYVICK